MNYRSLRVSSLLREELSKFILREVEFPNALVTVTDVEVDSKLEAANAKISVIPTEKEKEVLATLVRARGHLQHELNHKLNIKPMPHLNFVIDKGPDQAAHIEKLIIDEGLAE